MLMPFVFVSKFGTKTHLWRWRVVHSWQPQSHVNPDHCSGSCFGLFFIVRLFALQSAFLVLYMSVYWFSPPVCYIVISIWTNCGNTVSCDLLFVGSAKNENYTSCLWRSTVEIWCKQHWYINVAYVQLIVVAFSVL